MSPMDAANRVSSTHDRWLAWSRDRFGVLLGLIGVNYLILMALPNDRHAATLGTLMVAVTTLFALDAAAAPRRVRIVARTMVAIIPVAPVIFLLGGHWIRPTIPLSFGILLAMTTFTVLRHLLGHEKVNVATLLAAIDVYILIGLIFAQLFIAFAEMGFASPFVAQVHTPTRSDLVYLSFVTLTTVGFGDLTPLSKVARTLVVAEALVGQVFLVTAVARIISLFGQAQPPVGDPEGA